MPSLYSLKSLLLVPVLLTTTASLAAGTEPWAQFKCLPLAAVDAKIRYCTDNVNALASAISCSDQIIAAWNQAAKDLAVVQVSSQNSQNLKFENTDEKYQLAIERLETLIDLTEENADLIAQYPTVMVDNPSITSESESLPCYKNIFDQIQTTVSSLDNKISQGTLVLNNTIRLHENVRRLAGNISATSSASFAHRYSGAAMSAPRTPAANRSPASDITGTRERPGLN